MKNIGRKIKALRLQRNLKQQFLADRLQIHVSTYSQIENGNHELTLSRLTAILRLLNANYTDVLPQHPDDYRESEAPE
jgi:transcriptional regulator with XRE-family HTH domain